MDENKERRCPMDCARCSFRQNVYCAAQIGLSNHETLVRLVEKVGEIESKINAILDRADTVIARLEELQADMLMEPMAQEEEAAQTVGPQEKK